MSTVNITLVLNGPFAWTTTLAHIARNADRLYAADGGANALARVGLRPDAVIGDLDSISAGVRAWVGEDRLIHRPDQNQTDFEKSLEFIFSEHDSSQLTVLGALGDRIDHSAFNLGILARYARGRDLVLRTHDQEMMATPMALDFEAVPGETWSFWSFDPRTTVSLSGVRWPTEEHPIGIEGRPSISNEAEDTIIRVTPRNGTVIVCRTLSETP